MEFCIITPTAGLERYATLSRTHLVLSYITDDTYRNFYKKRRQEGDLIILDNGEYESQQDLDTYRAALQFYEPQVAVLPDFKNQPWQKTFEASKEFIEDTSHRYQWMYVPQSEPGSLFGWIEGLYEGLDNLEVDWVGIPRVLQTDYAKETPFVRAKACELIKRSWPHVKVHALGMANGDVDELNALRDAGCDVIDSSAPVWRGWDKGKRLTDPEDRKWWDEHGTPCDFTAALPLSVLEPDKVFGPARQIILSNLEACGVDTSRVR